jgi:headcase protein
MFNFQNEEFVNNYMYLLSTSHQQNRQGEMPIQQLHSSSSLLGLSSFPCNFIDSNTIAPRQNGLYDQKVSIKKCQYSVATPSNAQQRSTSPLISSSHHAPSISSHNSLHKLKSGDKLAITGNIFEKRADWSVIKKLPFEKQNTIHLRTRDEGPYGNDEIRCFVLSHLSSLKVKEVPCIFCSCNLIVYDRFPIVDGTLFVSPYDYDKNKSIPTRMPEKPERQQFMYGVCLQCITSSVDHQIKCKSCDQSWQNIGGSSLQIGTLYKYDIVAAFTCCQNRLNCKNCNYSIVNVDAAKQKYFSTFSDKVQCPNCSVVSAHFVKPLSSIFNITSCEKK